MTMGTDCIRASALAGFLLLAAGASAAGEPPPTPTINGNVIEGVRNARYCEIIPIVRDGLHLVATVYNTLGLNDCPAQVLGGITEDAMKQRFGAVTVLLNGPRFFLMDSITASGPTKTGEQIEAGGLSLAERATIDVGLLDLLHRPYREQTINRDTVSIVSRPDCRSSCSKHLTRAATPCRLMPRSLTRLSAMTTCLRLAHGSNCLRAGATAR
jgi:hypothetical protein